MGVIIDPVALTRPCRACCNQYAPLVLGGNTQPCLMVFRPLLLLSLLAGTAPLPMPCILSLIPFDRFSGKFIGSINLLGTSSSEFRVSDGAILFDSERFVSNYFFWCVNFLSTPLTKAANCEDSTSFPRCGQLVFVEFKLLLYPVFSLI